jgi:hypothetical protein
MYEVAGYGIYGHRLWVQGEEGTRMQGVGCGVESGGCRM